MVSNIFYVHPYLGKIPNLTNIFQLGWVETTNPGKYSVTCPNGPLSKNHQGFEGFPLPLRNPEGQQKNNPLKKRWGFHGPITDFRPMRLLPSRQLEAPKKPGGFFFGSFFRDGWTWWPWRNCELSSEARKKTRFFSRNACSVELCLWQMSVKDSADDATNSLKEQILLAVGF